MVTPEGHADVSGSIWNPEKRFLGQLPPAEAGTLRHFFELTYLQELGFSGAGFVTTRRCLRALLAHHGRDVILGELCQQLAVDHAAWLVELGLSADTVTKKYLRPWFAVWRFAHQKGLAQPVPKLRDVVGQVTMPGDTSELAGFFHQVFWPAKCRRELAAKQGTPEVGKMARSFTRTIHRFSMFLGRPALLSDLTKESVTAWLRARIGAQAGRSVVEQHIMNIGAMWRWANRHGYTSSRAPAIRDGFSYDGIGRELSRTILRVFFEAIFRPAKVASGDTEAVLNFSRAINGFSRYLGRPALLSDLTTDNVVPWLHGRFKKASTRRAAKTHRDNIAALWGYASEMGLSPCFDPSAIERGKIWQPGKPGPSKDTEPLEALCPGSLRAFYETVYKPQQLIGAIDQTKNDYDRTLRYLQRAFKREVMVSELSDALAAEFMNCLVRHDLEPVTVNGHRARLFALWRFAYDRNLVAHLPRVKKLKELLEEPDAWSELEAWQIIDTASGLTRGCIGGIPRGKLWRAFLLTGYWTALRRGSLLAIRRSDVDLNSGWLSIPPNSIKNRRGKRFRLGPDAIEAIREIWLPKRDMLFPANWDKSDMAADFNTILARAGIERSRRKSNTQMHKWRRTVGTLAAVRNGLAAAIALLGHSGPEVTKRYIDPTKLPGNDATELLPVLGMANNRPKSSSCDSPSDSPRKEHG